MQDHHDNQVRGYKAALHNPRVSEEAKEHVEEILENIYKEDHRKDPDNVARGLRAALSNPHVSKEAKEHAEKRLEALESRRS